MLTRMIEAVKNNDKEQMSQILEDNKNILPKDKYTRQILNRILDHVNP